MTQTTLAPLRSSLPQQLPDGVPSLSLDFIDPDHSLSLDFTTGEYEIQDAAAVGGKYIIWS